MPREPVAQAPLDDRSLIARVAARDHGALRVLVDRHWSAMHRHARALSADGPAAEDAVQDALVSVWEHAGSFRGEHGVRAWLYAIVRNAVRAQARRRVRYGTIETDELDQLAERAGFGDPGAGRSLERALGDREALSKGLAALSDDDREMVLLVDAEGLQLDEAAAATGITVAAAKSRLHRARMRLMAVLSEEDA